MLLLSRSGVARLMDFTDYVEAVEAGFRAAATGKALAPPAAAFHAPGGSYHAKAATLLTGDPPVMAIKLNGDYPGNPAANGLPTVQGVIYLADATNGQPLALMDSIEVTINRTGAATTLAVRHMARSNSKVATICGAGVQGRIQFKAVLAATALERVYIWDVDQDAAASFAQDMAAKLSLDVLPTPNLGPVLESDIVVTCTSSRHPFLTPALVRPGTFISAAGADNSDKSEIDPQLYARNLVVVDSLEQTAEIGDLHHALDAGAVAPARVRATLGELVALARLGRTGDSSITVFDSTGMGLQDVASAAAIYRRALAGGVGTRLALT